LNFLPGLGEGHFFFENNEKGKEERGRRGRRGRRRREKNR